MAYIIKFFKIVWTILNSRIFYISLIIIAAFIALQTCGRNDNLELENTKLEQNISAKSDSIRYLVNKAGDLQAEKEIFIKTTKELKKTNKDLYNKIKKQEGNIISLNTAIITLKQDKKLLQDSINNLNTIIGKAVKIDDNTWMIPWELQYQWDDKNSDTFKGRTFVSVSSENPLELKHDNTLLDERLSNIDIEFGTKTVDGKYNVYIKSKYPGFRPEQMEGVFIDPNSNNDIKKLIKKRHWFTGFSVGLSVTSGYNLSTGGAALVVGPSLTYNIYEW